MEWNFNSREGGENVKHALILTVILSLVFAFAFSVAAKNDPHPPIIHECYIDQGCEDGACWYDKCCYDCYWEQGGYECTEPVCVSLLP